MSDRFNPPDLLEIGAGRRAQPLTVAVWIFGTALLVHVAPLFVVFADKIVGPAMAYVLGLSLFTGLLALFEFCLRHRRLPEPQRKRGWAQDRAYGERALLACQKAVSETPCSKSRIFLPFLIQTWGSVLVALGYAFLALPDPTWIVLALPLLRLWFLWHQADLYRSMLPGAQRVLLGMENEPENTRYVAEEWLGRAEQAFRLLNPMVAAGVARPLDPVFVR